MSVSDDFERHTVIHLTAVYRAAMAIISPGNVAEDRVQLTFTKALKRFGSFEALENCGPCTKEYWIGHD
jgi:DNA-directed RNA polymerase specialized sigma24 family protein